MGRAHASLEETLSCAGHKVQDSAKAHCAGASAGPTCMRVHPLCVRAGRWAPWPHTVPEPPAVGEGGAARQTVRLHSLLVWSPLRGHAFGAQLVTGGKIGLF